MVVARLLLARKSVESRPNRWPQDRIGWNPNQGASKSGGASGGKSAEPNRTLFVENLPPEATDTMLSMLFRQYPGFQEIQLIPGRNVAFADYQNECPSVSTLGLF